jgi:hypothetical protein
MNDYALLINGEFKEFRKFETKPDDIPHKNVTWHDVVRDQGEEAFTGLENGNWVIRTALPSLDEMKETKLFRLADMRWQKETGGMVYNNIPLSTDPTSQTKYVGAVVGAQLSPNTTMKWKLSSGNFVILDAATIVDIAMAVRNHIQLCFDREAELAELIQAAPDKETLNAIDITTGWPT